MNYSLDLIKVFFIYIIFNNVYHVKSDFDQCINTLSITYQGNTTLKQCVKFIIMCGKKVQFIDNRVMLNCEDKHNIVTASPSNDIYKFNKYLISNINFAGQSAVHENYSGIKPYYYCLNLYAIISDKFLMCKRRIENALKIYSYMSSEAIFTQLFYGFNSFEVEIGIVGTIEYDFLEDYTDNYINMKIDHEESIIMVYCTINYPNKLLDKIILKNGFHIDTEKSDNCKVTVSAAFGGNHDSHECIKYEILFCNKLDMNLSTGDIKSYYIYLAESIKAYYNADIIDDLNEYSSTLRIAAHEKENCEQYISETLRINHHTTKMETLLKIFKGHDLSIYSNNISILDIFQVEEGDYAYYYILHNSYKLDRVRPYDDIIHDVITFCDILYTYFDPSSGGGGNNQRDEGSGSRKNKGKDIMKDDQEPKKRNRNITIRN